MAFDGAYLHKIKQEIDQMVGARIDKISQPTHDSIVIALRGFSGGNRKLLVSAEAAGAKLHFTRAQLENPKTAPMFCMLLRKHLGSGKLLGARQIGLDRVLTLVFETVNELGDRVELSLVCEIMGRRSNLILVDANGKVIDAIKRVDFVTSQVRQILSGITYQPPPGQQKLNPLEVSPDEIAAAVCTGRDIPLSKALLEVIEGFSPVLCREISHRVCGNSDSTACQLTDLQRQQLVVVLAQIAQALSPQGGQPTLVRDKGGQMVEFSFIPLTQYPESCTVIQPESYSALLDDYFSGKDLAESMRQKSGDLRRQLCQVRDRITRKLALQRQEYLSSQNREQKREYGDIISANIYQMEKGDKTLRAVNFFSPHGEEITIPLDITLTPAKNAQRYYGEYRKAATAEKKLKELITSGEQELEYLEAVISQLDRCSSEAELQALREEVASQGVIPDRGRKDRGRSKPVKLPPLRYLSSDGFVILSGRNNLQNDQLTLRDAKNYDMWFHTQKIPGSHTIILTDGCHQLPERTLEEAAVIAACNSGAGDSNAKVPVDYTYIKNVKKPRGARPGMVIYDSYNTAMVQPDRTLAERLLQK